MDKIRDKLIEECNKYEAKIKQLEAGLREISTSKYCNYAETKPDLYGIGVTDGHRYCAKIAQKTLEETK